MAKPNEIRRPLSVGLEYILLMDPSKQAGSKVVQDLWFGGGPIVVIKIIGT